LDGKILKSKHLEEIGPLVDKRSFNIYVRQQSDAIFEGPSGDQKMTLVRPIATDECCFSCHSSE